MLTGMVFIVQDCAFRWGLVGWGKAMQEGWQRSQPPAAGGTCGAAAFGRARANAPRARARARVAPGLKKPAGTGPVTAVTGLTGPDRFRYRPVRNWPKFKF